MRVDLGAALARQAQQHFGALAGVGDALAREGLEEVLDQQHREDAVLLDHHAGGIRIGELRVEGVAQRGEERLGLLEVLDGEVHEDLLVGHGVSCVDEGLDLEVCRCVVYTVHKRYQRKWTAST
jgi:hypothetical protein